MCYWCEIVEIEVKPEKKKILFIVHHRLDRSPGQRYRFEQYFDFLNNNGYECVLSNILDEEDDKILYSKGKYLQKANIALKAYKKRWKDIRSLDEFDLVVIYREALLTPSIKFEKKVSESSVPVIFDFDDAIWVKDVSEGNKSLSFLKNVDKIKKVLPLVSHVTVGNAYLAEFALKYNPNVTIIPSTIDTEKYRKLSETKSAEVVIGWVGSHTTVKHFEEAVPILKRIRDKYPNVRFKVIGDPEYVNEELNIKGQPWSNDKEVELFNQLDIGIMPLPDNPWTKGKCGMKGLLYMAVETPAIMSPVGMNNEIVENGVNGFLPENEEEWFSDLSKLIEDKSLRNRIGKAGRAKVEERFSKLSQQQIYLDLYNKLTSKEGNGEKN